MKINLGVKNYLYPMPVTLVGATVNGKANYLTVAYVGIVDDEVISVGLGKKQHTAAGIQEHGTFSVNIPSVDLVAETDYCGMVSGKRVDKSTVFTNFYGELDTAPLIEECPVNMACRVIKTLELDAHFVFIGQIVETFCDETYSAQPFLYMPDKRYYKLGESFARAWHAGKTVKEQQTKSQGKK